MSEVAGGVPPAAHNAPGVPTGAVRSPAFQGSPWTRSLWLAILGTIWLIGFAGVFYAFDLPNSGTGPHDRIARTEIWKQLPLLVFNNLERPAPPPGDLAALQLWKRSGWGHLQQRLPLWAYSALIVFGAWGWGHLFLRCLSLPLPDHCAERTALAAGCGLLGLANLTLLLGLCGWLSSACLWTVLLLGGGLECLIAVFTWRPGTAVAAFESDGIPTPEPLSRWGLRLLRLALIPFLACFIGGAFLPEVDFDVKEYHFGGPKEWYQAGQIEFLPHNVYTSFPFLSEMFVLQGMVLYGDWYWGAIVGKGVLLTFAFWTALGLYGAGRRWFNPATGAWAAWIHLSTPWIYRISIIAYAEGSLTFYLFATLLGLCLVRDTGPRGTWHLLIGLLAGSAMACKYPGLVSVVLPACGFVVWNAAYPRVASTGSTRGRIFWALWWLGTGLALSIGPWLVKNTIQTGNPVYPLAWSVFGGTDWDAESNAKWKHGHSPDNYRLTDLAEKTVDVTLKSDWQTPLAFGLAPLALLIWSRWKMVGGLWLAVLYLFGTWWLLTHRIDRFWVPLIPVVSWLAGIAAANIGHRVWRITIFTVAAGAGLFNWVFMSTSLCGYNAYLLDQKVAADQTAEMTAPEVVWINRNLPVASIKVLCVGEAELFDARFAYRYNTVFDHSLLEEWCGQPVPGESPADWRLMPADDIRARFAAEGITHILVNWQEILRYRQTYGYSDFVAPKRFVQLQELGILGRELNIGQPPPLGGLNEQTLPLVQAWAPELIRQFGDGPAYVTFAVYPVITR